MKNYLAIIFIFFSTYTFAEKLENFKLPIYNSKETFELKSKLKKHKYIVINYWASWCTSCVQEMPELEALKKKYSKSTLFVGINAGERKKLIKKFLRKYKFSYLILEDKDRVVSKSHNVKELPRTYVLNKQGKIIFSGNRPPKAIP